MFLISWFSQMVGNFVDAHICSEFPEDLSDECWECNEGNEACKTCEHKEG